MSMSHTSGRQNESGNVILFILIGIILLGLVTAAIRSGGGEGANIDSERAIIQAAKVREYATDLERGVMMMMSSGISETALRFAHPDAPAEYGILTDDPFQLFSRSGGNTEYWDSPLGPAGEDWEFYGAFHIHIVGSNATPKAELIAVLPDVGENLCRELNRLSKITDKKPTGLTGQCLKTSAGNRFTGSYTDGSASPINASSFGAVDNPFLEACIECDDGLYYYYRVLVQR